MEALEEDPDLDERRTGGAGASRQPTTDREYREQMQKLVEMAGK